ncbi:MAG: hypothetical protein ACLQGP_09885 [Isosphaeraceae bacterium]
MMDRLFPFGFPWPTAMYLALFVVSATIYAVLIQYVLGGGILLIVGAILPGVRRRLGRRTRRSGLDPIVKVLREGMPMMLGLAIAAGLVPLLFLQVLYHRPFEPDNALGLRRFLVMPPALIAAFFLLYWIKIRPLAERGPLARAAVTSLALAAFVGTAWLWTEDHVRSLRGQSWGDVYASGRWFFRDAEMWPRLGYVLTASFPTLATVLAWQLHRARRRIEPADLDLAASRLRTLAILGLAASAAEAWVWVFSLDPPERGAILGILALPYGLLALAGMGVQAAGWLTVKSSSDLNERRLAILSAGAVLTIFAALVLREARRLAAIDIAALYDAHRHAAGVGGLGVLLIGLILATAIGTTCVWMIKHMVATKVSGNQ